MADSTRHPITFHPAGGGVLLLALLGFGSAAPASASSGLIWDLHGIDRPGLYEQSFEIEAPTILDLEVVGAGTSEFDDLHAYGWILNLDTHRVVWRLTLDTATPDPDDDETWTFTGRIELPAGPYVAYFNAIGRHLRRDEEVRIGDVRWGFIQTTAGKWFDWDTFGEPDNWMFQIRATDADVVSLLAIEVASISARETLVDFSPLGSNAFETAAFQTTAPITVDIHGTFEFDPHQEQYGDVAWITDARTGDRIWEPNPDDFEPAGGAEKNHLFTDRIRLKPGEYIVTATTDDSHAYQKWNEAAPWNPAGWGIEVRLSPEDRELVSLIEDPRGARAIARIERVKSGSFVRRAFRVSEPLLVRIEGLAELGKRRPVRLLDYGWIERLPDRMVVWTMQGQAGEAAGGSSKNRRIRGEARLAAGDYMLCYLTDAGHAFEDWGYPQPNEPDAWGIGVYAADSDFDPASVQSVPLADVDPAIVSLSPNGDNAKRSQVMTLPRAFNLRVIAMGERFGGVFYDYGWIENLDTGKEVWSLKTSKTEHAGGGQKNRLADEVIRLQAGRYRIHYVSDGSHAFGSWNAGQPDHPELWGISIYAARSTP
jgi:hypothetical protein